MKKEDFKKNAEGYSDPTVYEAFKNMEKKGEERFHKLLDALYSICDLAGFQIEERIVLKDKHTGKVWR